jgi:hypothetical protein
MIVDKDTIAKQRVLVKSTVAQIGGSRGLDSTLTLVSVENVACILVPNVDKPF